MRSVVPRVSIGMPVYNGQQFLAEALDAFLGQTFDDFELVISDNASTDDTEGICRAYAARDDRIRYVRQPRNVGVSENHRIVVVLARGELFKWAGHDDLYSRDYLERCVRVLDAEPDIVLSTCLTAMIAEDAKVKRVVTETPRDSDSPSARARYRGFLYAVTGDDDYGVIRTAAMRRTSYSGSYYHADRSFVAELSLHGRIHRIPEPLYFRRDRADRAGRPKQTIRGWCSTHDPRRASRWRHPVVRLLAEYLWAFVAGIARAPIPVWVKLQCLGDFVWYLVRRAGGRTQSVSCSEVLPEIDPLSIDVDALVAGRVRNER
jgi:glycosyltransferase involved in cell wall biosynthesis